MNKKYMIIGGIALTAVIAVVLFFNFKSPSLKTVLNDVKECSSYTLESSMDLLENDELKSYQVKVTYQKKDKDYFKVELYDKSLNQSQVIVRNDEGVYVLTPTLNQAFKFQSEWPLNSPKPYIYQSLIEFLENNEVEKVKDGYLVTGEMKYDNDERVASQEVKFDKELKPIFINVYDKEHTEIMKLTISDFTLNIKLDDNEFDEEKVLESNKSQYTNVSASLPLYPVALMGSSLQSEQVSKINNETNHILQFGGEKSFTLVETTMSSSEKMNVQEISSDIIDLVDGFAYKQGNRMTYISSGIVCSLYSSELDENEMLSILSSMQSASVK